MGVGANTNHVGTFGTKGGEIPKREKHDCLPSRKTGGESQLFAMEATTGRPHKWGWFKGMVIGGGKIAKNWGSHFSSVPSSRTEIHF